ETFGSSWYVQPPSVPAFQATRALWFCSGIAAKRRFPPKAATNQEVAGSSPAGPTNFVALQRVENESQKDRGQGEQMDPLATSVLCEHFLRDLRNVTTSTLDWYEAAFKALQKTSAPMCRRSRNPTCNSLSSPCGSAE